MKDDISTFLDKKAADSPFLTVKPGESVKILKLKDIKLTSKPDFVGKEKEVLRLIVEINTTEGVREKFFDNPTQRFAKVLQEAGIGKGSSFTLSREGEMVKTRYSVSNVVNVPTPVPASVGVAPTQTPATA